MTGTRIVAAVLDKRQLLLYAEDGTSHAIPQGDHRIKKILDQVTPILSAGGVATVDIEDSRSVNSFTEFEKKTSGLVRFFRVAKRAVAHLFGADEDREHLAPVSLGKVPDIEEDLEDRVSNPAQAAPAPVSNAAIDQIMAHATPVSSSKFNSTPMNKEETLVAVVGEGADTKIVPGVETLKDQFQHAVKLGSTIGLQKLVERLGAIIATGRRGHSVQDVLRFLERGDLPIADDGSIIAYKILRRHPTEPNTFVDCHTRRIPQKVGSYVCVAEQLVDRDRRNECSNGLHIARRGYLGNFEGDVCVLAKVAPEDVVTVPHNDPNKVRVCGYHILGVIPPTEFLRLRRNEPMTEDSECRKLLARAISGNHVARLEQVLVTQQKGEGVVITPLDRSQAPAPAPSRPTREVKNAVALDDKTVKTEETPQAATPKADPVDPKALSQKIQAQKAQPSRAELAAELIGKVADLDLDLSQRREAAEALVALKKRTKVGYATLGLSNQQEDMLLKFLKGEKTTPVKTAEPPATTKLDLKQPEIKLPPKVETPPRTRQQEARYLADVMMNGKTVPARVQAAKDLQKLKQTSKVSWGSLGIKDAEVKEVTYLTTEKKAPIGPVLDPKGLQAEKDGKKTRVGAKAPALPTAPETNAGRKIWAAYWYAHLDAQQSENTRLKGANALQALKKASKVGWGALGLPDNTGEVIEKMTKTQN